jgi:hypothetical protein
MSFRRTDTIIETRSGSLLDVFNPDPGSINIRDISFALSRIPQFNGQTAGQVPYSLAQHAIWVAMVFERTYHASPKELMQAFMYDAYKAYIGDMAIPIQRNPDIGKPYLKLSQSIREVIFNSLEIEKPTEKTIDKIIEVNLQGLAVESFHLMASKGRGWGLPKSDVPKSFYMQPLQPSGAFQLFNLSYEHIANYGSLLEIISKLSNVIANKPH